MPSNESAILKSIVEYLELQGWPIYRMNSGTFQDARTGSWIKGHGLGTPDLCVGYKQDGYILLAWIEVKDKAKVSDAQISFLRKMQKLGSPWLVAHSVDDVIKWQKDRNYHGDYKDTKDILDETQKFVPQDIRGKRQKLTMSTMNEFNGWADKNKK